MPYVVKSETQPVILRDGYYSIASGEPVYSDTLEYTAAKSYFQRQGTNRNTVFGTQPLGAAPSKAWPKQYIYKVYEKVRWKKVILYYRTHTRRNVYGYFWPEHLNTPRKRKEARRVTPVPVRKVRRLVASYLVRLEHPKPVKGRVLVSYKKIKRRRLFSKEKPPISMSTRKALLPNDLDFRKTSLFLTPARDTAFRRWRFITDSYGSRWVIDEAGGRINPSFWVSAFPEGGGWSALNGVDWQTPTYYPIVADYGEEQRLRDAALSKLYRKIRDQNVNLAVALAEGGPTIKMFKSIVVALAKVVSGMSKGDIFAFSRLTPRDTKELANLHLANTYGLQPFLDDLDGFVKHLATRGATPDFKIGTAAWSERHLDEDINTGPQGSLWSSTGSRTQYHKMKYRCSLEFRINDPKLQELAQLGFTNPEAVAWELIPYSFVIDWFIKIGDYLTNWNAMDHIEVLHYYETVVQQDVVMWNMQVKPPTGWIPMNDPGPGMCRIKSIRVQRFVYDQVPPMPKPSFKNPFSLPHLANAVALLRQVFR